jgi:uncharacterized protein
VVAAPPCTNDYVASLRDRHPGMILQAWGAVDPYKGKAAIQEAERAVHELGVLGFHVHPIMGRYRVDDQKLYPLWETIAALRAPVMIDVGTTGMGAGMPGGLGSRLSHAHPMAVDNLAADFPEQLRRDVRSRLHDKVMFGSDHPSLPHARILAEWAQLGYSDDVLEQVFHGNAERVLGL